MSIPSRALQTIFEEKNHDRVPPTIFCPNSCLSSPLHGKWLNRGELLYKKM